MSGKPKWTGDPEIIRRMHHDDGLSLKRIGDRLGVSDRTVANLCHRNGIEIRTWQPRPAAPAPLRDWLTPDVWRRVVARAKARVHAPEWEL